MFKKRSPRFRPMISDFLEDRAVPSTGGSIAQVSAAAKAATTSTTPLAKLTTELTQAGTQINAAYAAFATAVRQTEVQLIGSPIQIPGGPAAPFIAVQTISPSQALSSITPLISTLSSSVTSALSNVPGASAYAGVIGSGFTGSGPGSLLSEMTALFNAVPNNGAISNVGGSTTGTFNQSSLPLLFLAVEGTINSSYGATAVEGYLAGLGASGLAPTSSSSATAFNPTTFGTQANSAYATFASAARAAELTLPTATSTATATGTVASVTSAITSAADTLTSSLVGALAGTTAAPFAPFGQVEEGAALAALGPFLSVAAPNGVVPAANLSIFYTVGQQVIDGSYAATAIQGYIIGTFATRTSTGTGIGSTNSGSNSGGSTGSGTGTTRTGTGSTATGGSSTGTTIPVTTSGGNGTTTTGVGGTTGTTTGTGTGNTGTIGTGTTTPTGGTTTGTSLGGTTGTTGIGPIPGTGTTGIGTGIGGTGSGTSTTTGSPVTSGSGGSTTVSGIGGTTGSGGGVATGTGASSTGTGIGTTTGTSGIGTTGVGTTGSGGTVITSGPSGTTGLGSTGTTTTTSGTTTIPGGTIGGF